MVSAVKITNYDLTNLTVIKEIFYNIADDAISLTEEGFSILSSPFGVPIVNTSFTLDGYSTVSLVASIPNPETQTLVFAAAAFKSTSKLSSVTGFYDLFVLDGYLNLYINGSFVAINTTIDFTTFHNYSITLTPTQVDYYIDDELYGSSIFNSSSEDIISQSGDVRLIIESTSIAEILNPLDLPIFRELQVELFGSSSGSITIGAPTATATFPISFSFVEPSCDDHAFLRLVDLFPLIDLKLYFECNFNGTNSTSSAEGKVNHLPAQFLIFTLIIGGLILM